MAETTRIGGGPCHKGPIQQIVNDNGSIFTLGVDGYIRVGGGGWWVDGRVGER